MRRPLSPSADEREKLSLSAHPAIQRRQVPSMTIRPSAPAGILGHAATKGRAQD
jgi:hypothetical protein